MTLYQVTAEKPSNRPGQKIVLRVSYPSFTEAWLSMTRWVNEGWRITECPSQPEWPSFPVDAETAA